MSRRFFTSRITKLLAGAVVLSLLLFVLVASQLENLVKRLANSYLTDAGISIETLRLSPADLMDLKLPMVLLKVDNNLVRLEDIGLTLAKDWLSAPIGLAQIESLAVRRAQVSLSQDYFDSLGRQQDSGTSSALNLGALPQIALGEISFNLLGKQSQGLGARSQPLGLKLDYLNLDNRGQLTGALSFYQAPLLTLAATLDKTRWQLTSRLEFEPLGRLIGELSSLTSNASTSRSASSTGQQTPALVEATLMVAALHDVNARLTQAFSLSGSLSSQGELDLIKGELHSRHEFSDLNITLKRLADQPLSPAIAIAVNSHDQSGHAHSAKSMAVDLSGPLNDLHLTLSPFWLSSSTSLTQLRELAGESASFGALLTALEAQSPNKQTVEVALELGAPTNVNQVTEVRETQTKEAQRSAEALNLAIKDQTLTLGTFTAKVATQGAALTARLEQARLAKIKPQEAKQEVRQEVRQTTEPAETQQSSSLSVWQLIGDWQIESLLKQPLCLMLPPYPQPKTVQDLHTSKGCETIAESETTKGNRTSIAKTPSIENRLNLAAANLKIQGRLDARQAEPTTASANDTRAPESSALELTLTGQLALTQPEFTHQDVKVGASKIATEIPKPVHLFLQAEPEPALRLDWRGLNVAIDGHHLSWPASYNKQGPARSEASKLTYELLARLTSEQTRTSLGAGHFSRAQGKPILAELSHFKSVTDSPHLVMPAPFTADTPNTSPLQELAPNRRELFATELVLEAVKPVRLDEQTLLIPPIEAKVISLAASEQKAVKDQVQVQAQAQVQTQTHAQVQAQTQANNQAQGQTHAQTQTMRLNLDELRLATQTIRLRPQSARNDSDTKADAKATPDKPAAAFSFSPDALLAAPWQSSIDYRLTNLKLTQERFRLNKLRRKTLIKLPSANLNQSLQWHGIGPLAQPNKVTTPSAAMSQMPSKNLIQAPHDLIKAQQHLRKGDSLKSNAIEHYGLTTLEQWNIDGLPFASEHHLSLSSSLTPQVLKGALTLTSDANELMKRLTRLAGQALEDSLIGDINLTSQHSLNWNGDNMDFSFALTPEVKLSEGSLNALPFEQAEFTGQCQLAGVKGAQALWAKFSCDSLSLDVAAFNPGVLLTDINAHAKLKLDLTQGANDASLDKKTEDDMVLSGADVKLDARANTLGGEILLPIFDLNLGAPSSAYLVLQGLDLEQLLAAQPQTGIYADGIFDGVLPVRLEDGQVSITQGQLAARAPGGLIKVDDNPAVLQMRLSQPYLDFAFSALEELHYTQLSSSFDMAPNGDALLKVQVKGRAKDIERPIHLNYAQEENMLQLLKSLQIGDRLQSEIERAMAN
ncbi:YdbH domain-containing protein [Shewanella sp. Isolate8]|uniref:YdbH domain-containing protein n=1 Tax=Shewanella sp. Isolate8 TaxID=2908529 RepID=UPI001EFD617A|nr:YdbH domain-containing protein [Shewanella sp. Isolate8]MCG9746681.1 YdbH domain-containing protein [Shewanella sp. Isolate8]